jgi:hypothetical protein
MTEQDYYNAFLNGVSAGMKKSRKEIIDLLEGIKAELKEIYDFSFGDDMVEAKFGLRTAINLIDEKLKEYTESKIST